MDQKKKLSRKNFLKLATLSAVTALASGFVSKKALAVQSMTESPQYDEPAIGQPGYEKRVAKLFKGKGLPEKATRI